MADAHRRRALRYLSGRLRDPLCMTTDRVLSVIAIVGIGVPMLVLAFDYAIFGVLTLVQHLVGRAHQG